MAVVVKPQPKVSAVTMLADYIFIIIIKSTEKKRYSKFEKVLTKHRNKMKVHSLFVYRLRLKVLLL